MRLIVAHLTHWTRYLEKGSSELTAAHDWQLTPCSGFRAAPDLCKLWTTLDWVHPSHLLALQTS